MRRLAIALSISVALFAASPGAALSVAEKNDSVTGHGFVVFDPTTTYDAKVSAHTLSSTTTAATGTMYITATEVLPDGTITLSIYADVYCVSVLSYAAEVRGHITRASPPLTQPTDLIFDIADTSSFTTLPDFIEVATEPPGSPCVIPDELPVHPVAKGDFKVTDESPVPIP